MRLNPYHLVSAAVSPLIASAFSVQVVEKPTRRAGVQRSHNARPVAASGKPAKLRMSSNEELDHDDGDLPELRRIPPDMEGVAIPFVDVEGNAFIECYADSVAHVLGVEYTIGVPCDYSVALCYYDDQAQLVPVEVDDQELMDDIFPIAESIVAEEFGEELSLQRTPQTLTLVGELEEDEDDNGQEAYDGESSEADDEADDEEEVEVLLSFEHRGKEFNLVRLLDPILLVGKVDPGVPDNRLLLTAEESDRVMPLLEEAFLDFHGGEENEDLRP